MTTDKTRPTRPAPATAPADGSGEPTARTARRSPQRPPARTRTRPPAPRTAPDTARTRSANSPGPTGPRTAARPAAPAAARPARPATPEPAPGTRNPGKARNALGRYGEDLAARRLRERGMVVLERNWRCTEGEIDLIARDRDALVICEVKTRRTTAFQHPMEALPPRRTARLRRLAARWLSERWLARHGQPPPGGVRIDLIGVLLPQRGAPTVEHIRGVG